MISAPEIKAQALELGFDLCGIAPVGSLPELGFLREWIDLGYAGEMTYMTRSADRRADVRAVLPSARSVVMLATVYDVDRPYSIETGDPTEASIARYAWGDDYHQVIGARTDALCRWMAERAGAAFQGKAYVDTGPVQERVYAQHAGLGWIGKNTCLINAERGSWLFLSEVICSLDLPPDEVTLDQCGSCTLCLEACPTEALPRPWVLDATKCLSYLTIELKNAVPESQRDGLTNHVFGCDICQDVCPWNSAPAKSDDGAWAPRATFDRPRLTDLWTRSDAELRVAIKGSALKRAGVKRLRRNLAVALGNSGDVKAQDAFDQTMGRAETDKMPSVRDPVVAEHVDWAQRKLALASQG
ncbi:MAG: tRNA epoxyqueuosine(34) reductase QueG [Acidobacteriota bacterium]|nr:tRNA epoxyqueuosine(34) reductase QueG [Acidobacteriota bacterium]